MKNADFTDAFTQIYLRKALLSLKNWVSVKVKSNERFIVFVLLHCKNYKLDERYKIIEIPRYEKRKIFA